MAARLNINPNRMELTKLKKRLTTAVKGHKLLKDKQDELMRRFIEMVRRNNELRKLVESELAAIYAAFAASGHATTPQALSAALMCPKAELELETSTRNIMSVIVPVMKFRLEKLEPWEIMPYGYLDTVSGLDEALLKLYTLLPALIELAETEKSCNLMTDEIEKTRRRVNALEHMTIPRLKETIRYIRMKLDENERGNLTRLMKVKAMLAGGE